MLAWFPVAGLILGALWAFFDMAVGRIFPFGMRAAVDVLFMVLLTGGLHLDGLADTMDGLLSHRGREDALRIMKDSRIGTWGVLALIFALGLKAAALSQSLADHRFFLLLLVPAYGRLAMLIGMWALPYGRKEEGIAHRLFKDKPRLGWLPGALLVAAGSLLTGWFGFLVLNATFLLTVSLVLSRYKKKLGTVTGDMLGALGEITETALLIAAVAA